MALTIKLTPGAVVTTADLITAALLNLIANPTISLEGSVGSLALGDGSVTTPKLADGVLTADGVGRLKMADGYITLAKILDAIFTADAAGRAKFADGFVNTAKLLDGALSADVAGRLKMASNFVVPDKLLFNPGALGTTGNVPIDWSTGLTFQTTLTGNITFSAFNNTKDGQSIVIAVTQSAGGANTVTWTPTIKWRGGAAPVLTVTANKTDVFSIVKVGATFFGNYSQNY